MTNFSNFTHINEDFVCENCGQNIKARKKSCRNHCPFCLASKHVDVKPGDRANECKGLLKAVGYELHSKKGLMIIFKCQSCGETTKNIAACDDPIQPDDYDKILALTPKE